MRGKIPFVPWVSMWLAGASFAFVLYVKDILEPTLDHRIGRDFTNMWTGGRLVLEGRADCAFDLDCYRAAMMRHLDMPSLQNFSYPPHTFFIDAPFATMPYYLALVLWTVVGVLFFMWCAKPYLPRGFAPILAALTPAGCINIWNGHYGFILGGLWLLFFRYFRDDKPLSAGVVAGLLTFKPHMGILIAATALWKRKILLVGALTTLALILLSAFVFGPDTWWDFFTKTTAVQAEILNRNSADSYFKMMPTPYVTWWRNSPGLFAEEVVIMLTAVLLWQYRKWDAFIASTVTFLILPYAFNYDMTVACLGFVLLLYRDWDDLNLKEKAGLLLAFLTPNLTYAYYVAWIVPIILLYALYIQLTRKSVAASEPEPQLAAELAPTT